METTKDKKDFDNFVVGSKKREKTTNQQQRKKYFGNIGRKMYLKRRRKRESVCLAD